MCFAVQRFIIRPVSRIRRYKTTSNTYLQHSYIQNDLNVIMKSISNMFYFAKTFWNNPLLRRRTVARVTSENV